MTTSDLRRAPAAASDGERREVRRAFRRRRRALRPAIRVANAQAVARHFFAAGLQNRGRTICAYLANERDGELSTTALLGRLLTIRKHLALPVVRGDGAMDLYRYDSRTRLVRNRFGIVEPAPGATYVAPLSVDLLLVPLVAFDDRGVRLGMGAGYYDRYLGRLPAAMRPRLIGLAHEVQRSPQALPFASWDVPLDGVITERGWRSFPTARPTSEDPQWQ